MKTVFAPVLLSLLATTLVAAGASARQDSQPQQHMQSAAQREARQDRAQQDRAQQDRAQLRADRERAQREAQRDRMHRQAERARARIEGQGDQVPQPAATARAQAAQAAQQQRQAQRARAQAEAQAQHARLEARAHRERREERRAHRTSHQPIFLPNTLFAAAALHPMTARPGVTIGADAVRAPVAPARVVPASAAADLAAMRGDQLMREGEIAAARLQYRDAVAAGSAHAAAGLGRSFDPSVLATLGAAASDGDSLAAAVWYQRAQMMGNHEADAALRILNARPAN